MKWKVAQVMLLQYCHIAFETITSFPPPPLPYYNKKTTLHEWFSSSLRCFLSVHLPVPIEES